MANLKRMGHRISVLVMSKGRNRILIDVGDLSCRKSEHAANGTNLCSARITLRNWFKKGKNRRLSPMANWRMPVPFTRLASTA